MDLIPSPTTTEDQVAKELLCVNVSSSVLCINQSVHVNKLLPADEDTHESPAAGEYQAMEM